MKCGMDDTWGKEGKGRKTGGECTRKKMSKEERTRGRKQRRRDVRKTEGMFTKKEGRKETERERRKNKRKEGDIQVRDDAGK